MATKHGQDKSTSPANVARPLSLPPQGFLISEQLLTQIFWPAMT